MDETVKCRLGILRVDAELDEKHKHLLQQIKQAEAALLELSHVFTYEEIDAIWALIHAYHCADQRILELACESMIFRSELVSKDPQ